MAQANMDFIFCPGETLKEIIDDRNITQKQLASMTGVTKQQISRIINGAPITSIFAKKLEYALGVDASFWLNLQANYEAELAECVEIGVKK